MDYLQHFQVEIEAVGPVFIGGGMTIGKKEYVYLPQEKKIMIPNMWKMYRGITKAKVLKQYETYLLSWNDKSDLKRWFEDNRINRNLYEQWMDYTIEAGDFTFDKNAKKEIILFVKDAYGMPYIPGSSLKVAIRTILLSKNYIENPVSSNVSTNIEKANFTGRKGYLAREIDELEVNVFNTLNKNEKRKSDAVNDSMSGLIIGDSRPLNQSDLVLCQKIEVHTSGEEKSFPILRECIKPGTKMIFDITIDTQVIKLSYEKIIESINVFINNYNDVFVKKYKTNMEVVENSFYLGGGSGYVSKTITYPVMREKAVLVTSKIIDNTLSAKGRGEHKHFRDVGLKVSPHILKCTRYKGKLLQMGLVKVN